MAESKELAGAERVPLKRSVFRPDVLQREIERRDDPVALDEVPRFSVLALAGCTILLLLAFGGLLAEPVTLSTGIVLKDSSFVAGSGQDIRLLVMTKDPRLIVRGSVLIVQTLHGVWPLHLQVEDVAWAPGYASVESAGAVLAVKARAQDGQPLQNGRLDAGPSSEVALRTRFIHCLSALVGAR